MSCAKKKNDKTQISKEKPYHHGALREGLLEAAERILVQKGIEGLTLRAAAREAGVSPAAPKNHFQNLTGLLSDLAATGFARFRVELTRHVDLKSKPDARMKALCMGYLSFAKANPALFLLMFRSERLDYSRPLLSENASAALLVLSNAVGERREENIEENLTLEQIASVVGSWSLVHGFTLLLLDGRLDRLLKQFPEGETDTDLLSAILSPTP